jgi:hypothetical protein
VRLAAGIPFSKWATSAPAATPLLFKFGPTEISSGRRLAGHTKAVRSVTIPPCVSPAES